MNPHLIIAHGENGEPIFAGEMPTIRCGDEATTVAALEAFATAEGAYALNDEGEEGDYFYAPATIAALADIESVTTQWATPDTVIAVTLRCMDGMTAHCTVSRTTTFGEPVWDHAVRWQNAAALRTDHLEPFLFDLIDFMAKGA